MVVNLWSKTNAMAAAAVVVAMALLTVSPGPVRAEEAVPDFCGPNSGSVCWENESCINIIFYKQCTTTYKYYAAQGDGDGGGGGGGF